MLENIEACIFDLDGTLVDSMWMWKTIDIEYLARFGIELPEDLQTSIAGMSFSETAVYFKERFGIEDPVDEIKKTWNDMAYDIYCHRVETKPGLRDFLKMLKERGIKTGIATSNSKELLAAVLEALGLYEFFDEIHTACEVEKGKPAPDIYLLVAGKLGADPSKCLVFEDLCVGLTAGKNAGMRTCAVRDDFSEAEWEEKKKLADHYIETYVGVK